MILQLKKYNSLIYLPNRKLLNELWKDWIKISLGSLGNFSAAIMSIKYNKEQLESFTMMELLLIE